MFDGSSIAGWKAINESDMALVPDPATAAMDPFYAEPTVTLFCDVVEPLTGEPYDRCPRSIAKKAEAYLAKSGIGDAAYFGRKPNSSFSTTYALAWILIILSFSWTPSKPRTTRQKSISTATRGTAPASKGGYFPVNPVDSAQDLRTEMVRTIEAMGVEIEKHHHEVAASQHELGIKYATLVKSSDNMQIYKYAVHNVAHIYGKTATFMPKPVFGRQRLGMHTHQSIWKAGKPLFAGKGYAELSDTALYYIGGIIKHAKALNALTNPTTNSYKRLVPGYEAPVLLAYSSRNRSASCRIPFGTGAGAKRVEVRFRMLPPTPTSPSLACSWQASTASKTKSTPEKQPTKTSMIFLRKSCPKSRRSADPWKRPSRL